MKFQNLDHNKAGVQWPNSITKTSIKKSSSQLNCPSAAEQIKVLLRTGHDGTKGEQMYSFTLPSTSALDGGGWSTPCPGRFIPGKDPVHIV